MIDRVSTVMISFLTIIASTLLAGFIAFQIDWLFCENTNGNEAAGGGAALGIFVIFFILIPSMLISASLEFLSFKRKFNTQKRVACAFVPSVLTAIFMSVFSYSICY